ncbi:metallophosphoesterase [Candidatus Pacearchaeota archaeon]|jgi:hypothetical protein|nr:metallophosphoesterase [Candidatus Pacearchaeota archaeon]
MTKVAAILCADIHLSEYPPVARSVEPDWLAAQGRCLDQLRNLATNNDNVPIIAAGDIFDRWNSSAAIINWAIDHLPPMWAIHGQHDLPMHNNEDLKRSAYWTLVKAGTIKPLGKSESLLQLPPRNIRMNGFPWGVELEHPNGTDVSIHVAVVHSFLWIKDRCYIGAPIEQNLTQYQDRLRGYDVAVFGDNHQSFLAKCNNTIVFNCGCLIPRKSNERFAKPSVGVLYADGSVKQQFLDTSEDKWIEESHSVVMAMEDQQEMIKFVEGLRSVNSEWVDFKSAVIRYLEDHSVVPGVKKLILKVMEDCNGS